MPVDSKEPFTAVDFSVLSGFDITSLSQEYKLRAERGENRVLEIFY